MKICTLKDNLMLLVGIVLSINIYTFAIDKIQFAYLIFYLGIFLILLFYNFNKIRINISFLLLFLCIITILFSSLLYTADFPTGLRFSMFFIVFLGIQILLINNNEWHSSFYYTILILGYVFVAATIFAYFFPKLFIRLFFPLFNEKSKIIMLRLMNVGAQVGLTNQTAKNGFLISVGLGILINAKLKHNRKQNVTLFVSVIIFIVALIMTKKRSLILANAISILIISYFNHKIRPFIKIIILAGFIAIIIFIMTSSITFDEFTVANLNEFSSGRINILRCGLELFKEKPFFGHGIYSTPVLLERFGLYGIQQMHNIYLQFLVEFGILGACFLISILLIIYVKTYRLTKKIYYYGNTNAKSMLRSSLYIQSMWLIYGFFGNPFTEHVFLLTYMLFSSIAMYYNKIIFINSDRNPT